jgi:competence protein ComEC
MVEVHVLDVGQGDALALRSPRGRWVVVDAGGAWRAGDAGRTTVVPYIARRGGEVAAFVLSHPHTDHVGGAAAVIAALEPARYYDAAFAGAAERYLASLRAARGAGSAWTRVRPDDSVAVDGMWLTFLGPDSAWTAELADANDASVVLRVRYGDVRLLFMGDAEAAEEQWLLSRSASALQADVIKVGHHGSRTSSTPGFLDAVRPRVAIVSVGALNRFGHPSPEVVLDYVRRGAQVLRTDQLGTFVIRTDGRRLFAEAADSRWEVPRFSPP